MALDPSIALNVKPIQIESPINRLAQFTQLQGAQQQNALNAFKMKEAEEMAGERRAVNALLGRSDFSLDTPEGQAELRRTAPNSAGSVLEGHFKTAEAKGKAAKAKVDAEEAAFKFKYEKVNRHLQTLAGVNDPTQAQAWIQSGVQDGLITPEQGQSSLANVPQDPRLFPQWKQGMTQSGLTLVQQIEQQWKQRDHDLAVRKADSAQANDIMVPDGKGGFKPNIPLITAKQSIAKSGASSVSVNTGQKGYENESKLRNDFKSEPIYKDFQDMRAAHAQIKTSLAQGTPISDTASATKIMKLLDPGSVVRESELAIAMAAAGRLDRLQNYVQMQLSGEKLTPTQRKDFGVLADELMAAATQAYNAKRGEYEKFGKGYGLNTNVLGEEAPSPKPNAPTPGGVPADIANLLNKYGGK